MSFMDLTFIRILAEVKNCPVREGERERVGMWKIHTWWPCVIEHPSISHGQTLEDIICLFFISTDKTLIGQISLAKYSEASYYS